MNIEVANALSRYFESLYNLNQNLIMLCGVDVIDDRGQYEKYLEEIIHVIPRLIPYGYKKNSTQYIIMEKDGLMEFSKEISFLKDDYEQMLTPFLL